MMGLLRGKHLKFYFIILLCLAWPSISLSATLSGMLSEDETWSGNVQLTGDVTVPYGLTLTVSPGTTVEFSSGSDDQSSGADISRSELVIEGSLVAIGTSSAPITFTSSSSTPAKNDWVGIRVLSRGSLTLTYATIEYGENGIDYSLSSGMGEMSVTNCLIHRLSGIGIKAAVANVNTVFNGIFYGNEITETDGNGIYLYTSTSGRSELEIRGNVIHNVSGYGVYLYGNSSARINGVISDNEISYTDTGIYQYNYYGTISEDITYENNTIHNTATGLHFYTYHNNVQIVPVVSGNHIYDNSLYGIRVNKGWGSSSIEPRFYNNSVTNNSTGIHLEGGTITPEIIFNTITGNTSTGLSLSGVIRPVVLYNNIQGNGGTGILMNSSGTAYVHYNNISNESIYELQNNSSGAVDGRYNWWGDSATIQMDAGDNPKNITRILDIFDDGGKGNVDYRGWLNSFQILTAAPISHIIEPADGTQSKGGTIVISGIGSAPAGIDYVEVSVDNGQSWHIASGKTRWSYSWENPENGSYIIKSRVTDSGGYIESPGSGHGVVVDSALPTTSGALISDENWSGEIILTGDVTVPENIMLNVASGTVVRFQALSDDQFSGSATSRTELIVEGSLIVSGTSATPAIFTSSSSSPAVNDWVGIRVSGGGTVNLDYGVIEYAANGIDYSLSSGMGQMSVTNCLIHKLSGIGIRTTVANADTVFGGTFGGNEISETDGSGMYLYTHTSARSELEISGNEIHHVDGYGIYLYGNSSARVDGLIADNEISHTTTGIYQYNYYGTISEDIVYRNNTIHDTDTGLYFYTYHNNVQILPLISGNHIYDNRLYGVRVNKGWGSSTIVPELFDNNISNNGTGIHLEGGSITPEIIFNTITSNTSTGLSLAGVSSPVIIYNDIQGNDGTGLLLNSSGTAYVHYNNISNESAYELQNNSSGAVDARYNWWGLAATTQMNAGDNPINITRIFDIFDDSSKGSVDYREWLDGAQVLTVESISRIIDPVDGLQSKGGVLTITGIAAAPAGVGYVEVSVDNGQSWHLASGRTRWNYSWATPGDGDYILLSRVIDLTGDTEVPGAGHSVTIDSSLPTTSGSLSSNENWSGEITITGDITVPEYVTLSIDPGAVIRFQPLSDDQSLGIDSSRSELIIEGSLEVHGTSVAPVIFTSSSPSPARNDWAGLRVLSRGSVNLTYATIEYAANGIDYSLSSGMGEMSVVNCLIHKLSGIGIKTTVANANTVFSGTFTGNEISETGGSGMFLYTHTSARSELEISGNEIHHVDGYGIYLYGNSSARVDGLIADNEISHTTTGIYQYNYYGTISEDIVYRNNTIHDTDTGLYFYTYHNNVQMLPLILGNHIYDNSLYGVRVNKGWGSSSIIPEFFDNSIINNGTGIHLEGGGITPEIIFNTISSNSGTGLSLASVISPVIIYNDIQGNSGTGLLLNSTGTAYVHYNNISNESAYELQNNSGATVDGRYNWWGNDATTQMNAGDNPTNVTRIFDIFDDGSKGSVDYSEWLNFAQVFAVEPVSHIIDPVDGLQSKGGVLIITGIASAPAGVDYVEVSVDNGQSWHPASGKTRWSYSWEYPVNGSYIIKSRVRGFDGNLETTGTPGHTVNIDSNLPTSSGTLIGDENWSGEIVLTGDVTVPENITLNIAAGSTIRFQSLSDDQSSGSATSRCELIIQGSLIANGTDSDPVTFTSSSASPVKNDWAGLRVLSGGSLTLVHAVIEYAANGIDYSLSSGTGEMSVTNCLIHQLSGVGIRTTVANAGTLFTGTFAGNEISETDGNGMYLYTHTGGGSELEISGNEIHHVDGYGIYLYGNSSARVDGLVADNEISHTTTGVYQYNYYGTLSEDITYRNNTIHDTDTGLYLYTYHNNVQMLPLISGNHIYDNILYGIRVNKGWGSSSIMPRFYNNSISNSGTAIYLEGGGITPEIIFNTITDNAIGLSLAGVIQPVVIHNDIQGNSSGGIQLNSTGTAYVHYNNFSNESDYELGNNSSSAVDARYNWFGIAATNQMNAGDNPTNITRILDIFDDGSKGGVDYRQWLNSAQVLVVKPLSRIIDPIDGLQSKGGVLTITGIASAPAGVEYVEVSFDNGQSWHLASGKTRWSYSWENPVNGSYLIQSRVTDFESNTEIPGAGHSVIVDSNLPTTSGTLFGDEIWSGEIVLTGDVTVPEDIVLSIAAGTVIGFQPLSDDQFSGSATSRTELIVEGSLVVSGMESAPVIFTSISPNPAANDWVGIRVSGGGTVNMDYGIIEYAEHGIDYSLSSGMGEMSVTNCLIHQLGGIGIRTTVANTGTSFTGTFTGNEIYETYGNGMYLYTHTNAGSELEIAGNKIHHVGEYGIHLYGNGSARVDGLIVDNEISHTTTGVYQYSYYGTLSEDITYRNNTIHDTTTGLYFYTYHNNVRMIPVVSGNIIYDNSSYGIRVNKGWGSSSIIPRFYNNIISRSSTGIHLEGGGITPEIIFNTIIDNAVGLSLAGVIQPVILHNDIQGNSSTGILLNSIGTAYVHFNNISNKHIYELQNTSGAAVDGRYNWWGAAASAQMNTGNNPKNISRIFDIFDDGTKGSVDYSEWLSGVQTLTAGPVSRVIEPVDGMQSKGGTLVITGIASAPSGVDYVEVSVDNGQNWHVADNTTRWSHTWQEPADGNYHIVSRVIDLAGNIETSGAGHDLTIDSTSPTTSGSLTGDENWSGDIILTGDVTVPENVTLNITSGTIIRFQSLSDDQSAGTDTSRIELIIKGSLVAAGEDLSPVIFGSSASNPAKNDWMGIRVLDGGTIDLVHSIIEYAANGIDYSLTGGVGEISVVNCLIHQLSGVGIKTTVANANTAFTGTFTGNEISDTDGNGMYLYTHSGAGSELEIIGNIIHHVAGNGIYLYGNGSARIDGLIAENDISHTTTGIYQYNYYGTLSEDIAYRNNEIHDTATGLYLYTYHNNVQIIPAISGNHIYDNSSYGIRLNKGWGSSSIVPRFHNNIVTDNSIGIHLEGGGITPEFILNTITGNSSLGISLAGVVQPVIIYNSIEGNGSTGILLNSSGTAYVHHNNISNEHTYEMRNDSGSSVDASYNWWGELATGQMGAGDNPKNISRLYDIFDNSIRGSIGYGQWLEGPQQFTADPVSHIIQPVDGQQIKGGSITITGIASAPAGIERVEVSHDNGRNWQIASGRTMWIYSWENLAEGDHVLLSRVIDLEGIVEIPGAGLTVAVDSDITQVSGVLVTDEIWNGQILLMGDVTVPEGITLTIQPGTDIKAVPLHDGQYSGTDSSRIELIVYGTLLIEAGENEIVSFSSNSYPAGLPGDWAGIAIHGSLFADYLVVEHAQTPVSFNGDSEGDQFSLKNSVVKNCTGPGLRLTASGGQNYPALVENNSISETGGDGIDLKVTNGSGLDIRICSNVLSFGSTNGIYVDTSGGSGTNLLTGIICDNSIFDYTSSGINLYTYNTNSISQLVLDNNSIHHVSTSLQAKYNRSSADSTLEISDNKLFTGLTGILVRTDYTSLAPKLVNNEIHDHSVDGIRTELGSSASMRPHIDGNDIYHNARYGIFLQVSDGVSVSNNSLDDNFVASLYNDSAHAIDAKSNWWGVDTLNEINSGVNPQNLTAIYDAFDNGTKGAVDYSDWLVLYDPPDEPTLDTVASPTGLLMQSLSGTKDSGSGILINGVQRVAPDLETIWSCALPLTEGRNSIAIKAIAESGMVSSAVQTAIVVDTIAPLLYSSAPADGAFVTREVGLVEMTILEQTTEIDAAATARGTVVDGSGEIIAGSWLLENSHLTFTPEVALQDGAYRITMHPTDYPLGNAAEAAISFTVDLGPPAAPVIDSYVSPRSESQIVISGTKEAGSAVWLSGAEIVALSDELSWSYTFSLVEGLNVFRPYSRDQAGNISDTVTFTVTLDTVPPLFISTIPADNSYINVQPAKVSFVFSETTTSIDEGATLASGDIFTSKGMPVDGSWSLQDGKTVVFTPEQPFVEEQYSLQVTGRDILGNARPASLGFTYDTTPPLTPTVNPVQSPTSFIRQTLSGTKEINSSIRINSSIVIPVDGQTDWSYSLRLAEGDNSFVIDSLDRAGNISGSVSTMIHYDETAPLTVDTLAVNGDGSGTSAFLDWTGYNEEVQGDVAYYRIYLQDSLFTQVGAVTPVATVPAGTFVYRAEGLSRNGLYYFAVIAVDDKENAHNSVTPVSAGIRDIVPPEPVENLTAQAVSDTLIFNWQASVDTAGDLAGYLFSFNNETAVELASPVTVQQRISLQEGTAYPCHVVAIDGDGNRSEAAAVTGVTLLPNPTGVAVTPYDGYVSISWNPVEPAEYVKQYAIYVSETVFTSITGKYPRLVSREEGAKIAWLTNDTEYHFAVAAVNVSNGSKQVVNSYPAIPVGDQQGPAFGRVTVGGTLLTEGMILARGVEVAAEVTDPISVSRVEFKVDGILHAVDYLPAPDYVWLWDIQNFTDGEHLLTLIAYDSLGNSREISFTVNIQLAPPAHPAFTVPAAGYLTNKELLSLAGEAEPDTTVTITSNDSEIAAGIVVTGNGQFSVDITLVEGENRLTAVAINRAGASAPSVVHPVILDSSIPDAPANINAVPRAGGQIKLDWASPMGGEVWAYNIFRSESEFTEISQCYKLNMEPVTETGYTDLTPEDGVWYYRVTSIDMAGNEGMLSGMVHASADRVPPKALAVVAHPYGENDGSRIGTGLIDLTVILSEPLQAAPFVSVVPDGGTPYALRMQEKDAVTWQGSYTVLDTTPSGTAYVLFSGRDIAGNRGTDIDSGSTMLLDSNGPEVVRLQVTPRAPISNDEQPQISVVLGLGEPMKAGLAPLLSYRLSAPGRLTAGIDNATPAPPQSGEAETWQAIFNLPSDAGMDGSETFSFFFEGRDDLENISTRISAYNQFQVYQGSLPPLAIPMKLTAKSLPEGKVALAWETVENAIGYQLYRKKQGEVEMQPLTRLTDVIYDDHPPAEDLWFYSVSSIREVGGVEAESGQSTPATVHTDGTAPASPENLILQLTPQGIMLEWQGDAADRDVTYSLYRSDATEIVSVADLDPLVTGLSQTMVIDPTPSPVDHCYVVTATDMTGNESPPSNSAYRNFGLLPVSEISVVQTEARQPVLSWSHPNSQQLSSFDISLQQGSGDAKHVISQPPTATSYVDSSYTGDERTYTINAVDENGAVSLGRSLFMPMLRTEMLPETKLERGIMNSLSLRVKNLGREDVAGIRLEVMIGGRNHISEKFDLQGGEYNLIPVIVGGYENLPDLAEITVSTIISPNPGETVRFIRSAYVDVSDGMLILQFGNEEFVRGVTGSVWFRLENSGDEEIEIITAAGGGTANSPTLRYILVDSDSNVLVTAPFKQVGTEDLVTLPNGNVVARIRAGGFFTSQPAIIEIPSGVPDELYVRLVIDEVTYHQGQDDEVLMQGLTGEFPVRLADTSYYGTVTSIIPEASFGDEDVIISGQAIERVGSDPLGLVPLKLVLSLKGFERTMEVVTDEDGSFSYTFSPLGGESGRYQVRAVHPDLLDKPVHGEFVIQRVIVKPSVVNLSIPRNYEQSFYVEAATGIGTTLTNLQLLYQQEDQEGGIYPEGVNLTPGPVVPHVGEQSTARLQVLLWANNYAADSGRLKLRLVSDDSGPDGWGEVAVNTTFSQAKPLLTFSPNHIEAGVVQDDMVTENITIGNTGLAALENVQLSLKTLDGFSAPSWLHLVIKPEIGDIEIGEERDIPISFSPGQDIMPGPYQFKLRVKSNNFTDTDIYLFAIVDQDGQGSVLFKASDIYTGTLNISGQRVEGLAGASITLQNEATLVTEPIRKTDELGEVEFSDLPAGWYKYRITAADHQEKTGRLVIKPGLTATQDIFLDYNLVTVSWEVKEITIEDKYEIVLTATFETDVPAAVVVAEPASLTLPELKSGMVYNGEFTLTNYGIVRADDLGFELPADDANFRFELLGGMPDFLEAKESITVAYRVTCVNGLEQEDGSGGGCYTYNRCITIPYTYKCANDVRTSSRTAYCWTYTYGVCDVGSSTGGSSSSDYLGISFSGPASYTTSSPVPLPQKLAGEECLGKCNCKPAAPPSCPTGICPVPENYVQVGSIVDTRLREYSRDTEDLTVMIPGGRLSVHRYYEFGQWFWEVNRDNLSFESNVQGVVEAIVKNGVIYENSSGAPDLFRFQNELIAQEESGYRWSDRSANWMEYDLEGRLIAYGLRDDVIARALYEEGNFVGWVDRNGDQVLWYGYRDGDLFSVSDANGRTVEYGYSGGLLHSVKDLRGSVTSYNYADGRLSRVEEPGGKVRNIAYNKYGDVISVMNDEGIGHTFEYGYDKGTREYYAYTRYPSGKVREVWYNYDGDVVRVDINGLTVKTVKYGSRVKWVTDERGYISRYDLDEWDNEIYILYPDESWVEKSYSHPWNLLTSINRIGVITGYEYDVSGWRTAMIEAQGTDVERRSEFINSDSGKVLSLVIKGGAGEIDVITRFSYDEYDRLLTITDPEGRITSFSDYDEGGNPQTVEDGRGIKKYLTYDAAGSLLTVHDNENKLISENRYDEAGNRSSVLNGYLKEYKLVYNGENNLVTIEDPLGNRSISDYNPAGKPVIVTDQEGNSTKYEYDLFERLTQVIDPEGNTTIYNYGDAGGCSSCSGGIDLPVSVIYPTFTREMIYDSRKRLTAQKDIYDSRERITSYSYDEFGNLHQLADPEGNLTTYEYDALGRKISESDAQENRTEFSYDSRDNLVSLKDGNGAVTFFEYDLSNRLVKERKPLLQETAYSYDGAGNLSAMIDANGRKAVYTYDSSNRRISSEVYVSVADADPAKRTIYSYNDAGSLAGYDDFITSATYAYDDLQRRISETVNYGEFSLAHSYSYYGNGWKKDYTDPAGRVKKYSYDKAGKPLGIDLGPGGQVSYNGYSWNKPSLITLPGGSTLNFKYDGLQQVAAIIGKDPAENPVLDYGYSYSPGGNITDRSTGHGDYRYAYDSLYRLTEVKGPDVEENFGYDPLANRVSSVNFTDWGYNSDNQLTGYGTTSFKYDNQGNMVERKVGGLTRSFSYSVDNRLDKITDDSGATVATYYNDPFGRRLWKDVAGIRTCFHYNDEGLVGEYDAAGHELRTYGYLPGSLWSTNPLFVQIDGVYYWYQNDHLGTPQKIIAGNGTTVWHGMQDAFGLMDITVEDITNNLRFPGQYWDAETGLHYNWHRYYDPATGRYISADPIGLEGGMNLYVYVGGDPVNWADPFGLKAECCPSEKVPIWVCKGDLGGDTSVIPRGGPISHSYITCAEPSTINLDNPKVPIFGFHPRKFGESGNILHGYGYVNREINRDPSKAECRKMMVCSEDKTRMCKEGTVPYSYFLPLVNCHTWANNRDVPPGEGDIY